MGNTIWRTEPISVEKLLDDRFKIAPEKMQHLANIFMILFLGNIALAWCLTLSHMIIKARPVIACLLRQTPIAAADFVNFLRQVDNIPDRL